MEALGKGGDTGHGYCTEIGLLLLLNDNGYWFTWNLFLISGVVIGP